MSLSALRLAEQDHPLPRTSRRWSVGHAPGWGGLRNPQRNPKVPRPRLCLLVLAGFLWLMFPALRRDGDKAFVWDSISHGCTPFALH